MTSASKQVVPLIADDDAGHARLIEKNLARAGLQTPIQKFANGQKVLDFLFRRGKGEHRQSDTPYFLLLDIHMPQVDGVEVLRQLKADAELRTIPVIMLTTSDDPLEVDRCHGIGCSHYVVKPVRYDSFAEAMVTIGSYISLANVPSIDGSDKRLRPLAPESVFAPGEGALFGAGPSEAEN
ncbi:MAG: response regulator [Verrucomicrobiia bacterium]